VIDERDSQIVDFTLEAIERQGPKIVSSAPWRVKVSRRQARPTT
jgi:hypothetical protein